MNKNKILPRLIVSPFIFCILMVVYIMAFLKHFLGFIKYGGEWITYSKESPKRMQDIYNILETQYEINNERS